MIYLLKSCFELWNSWRCQTSDVFLYVHHFGGLSLVFAQCLLDVVEFI